MGYRLLKTEKKYWNLFINFSFVNYLFSFSELWLNLVVFIGFSLPKKDLRKLSYKSKGYWETILEHLNKTLVALHYSWNALIVNLSSPQRSAMLPWTNFFLNSRTTWGIIMKIQDRKQNCVRKIFCLNQVFP